MNVVMYRFNGSSWVPMYPRTTIDQVQNLSSELARRVPKLDSPVQSGTFVKVTVNADGLVTSGQNKIGDADITSISPTKISGSGTIDQTYIPNLDASKITSGTFNANRIPPLPASRITSGVFNVNRIPELPISKVQNLSSELANLQSQIDNLSQSGGGWTLLYSGSTSLSTSSFSTINLSDSISSNSVVAIEVRYGSTSTTYHSKIILAALGSSNLTSASLTYPRKIGFTDFDGEYFKNIYFVAYRFSSTELRVGNYSYLRGSFLPSSNTIEWDTDRTLSVYITRVWKVY